MLRWLPVTQVGFNGNDFSDMKYVPMATICSDTIKSFSYTLWSCVGVGVLNGNIIYM